VISALGIDPGRITAKQEGTALPFRLPTIRPERDRETDKSKYCRDLGQHIKNIELCRFRVFLARRVCSRRHNHYAVQEGSSQLPAAGTILAASVLAFGQTRDDTCVETGHALGNGINLYYEIYGRGEPLILLHGGLGATEMFGEVVPLLAKTRRVIAVDLQAPRAHRGYRPPYELRGDGRRHPLR